VDSNGNPYGGNLLTVVRAELILPLPRKWQTSARASLFFDMGNTFSTDNVKYLGKDSTTPVDYKFKYDQLRKSTGVAVQWLAPSLGVFRFSYGIPLNKFVASSADPRFSDRTENFQFTIGGSF
jgi:outer membrane protein assembly factor BamA